MMNRERLGEESRGYLDEDFQFFHLKEESSREFEFHYHDFHKIIIFLSGQVTYLIEGKAYRLEPWDILLVNSHEIHRPLIDTHATYERIVIWVNSSFLTKYSSPNGDLFSCFQLALSQKRNLFRGEISKIVNLKRILSQLETACQDGDFGGEILKNSLFLQFLVYLNRLFLGSRERQEKIEIEFDEGIAAILNFINSNLEDDLSMEGLAGRFFISKYHLMRKFKTYTGVTVHSYIMQKRLLMAGQLIREGKPAMETCAFCGFSDYSNFTRCFKKMYGLPPRQFIKAFRVERAQIIQV